MVKLVSSTRPSEDLERRGILTPEDLIVHCARVSNPKNQFNTATGDKLIKYLMEHHHWSPFEMVSMTVEIQTSRAISTQILRHRSFSFQEYSQRYSSVANVEDISIRKQADKNRQSSSEEFDPWLTSLDKSTTAATAEYIEAGMRLYAEMIEAGVAKECARMVLPLASSTTLYMSGTVRSWIHYLQLRCADDTQLEHQEIAIQIRNIFIGKFPIISSCLWNEAE